MQAPWLWTDEQSPSSRRPTTVVPRQASAPELRGLQLQLTERIIAWKATCWALGDGRTPCHAPTGLAAGVSNARMRPHPHSRHASSSPHTAITPRSCPTVPARHSTLTSDRQDPAAKSSQGKDVAPHQTVPGRSRGAPCAGEECPLGFPVVARVSLDAGPTREDPAT